MTMNSRLFRDVLVGHKRLITAVLMGLLLGGYFCASAEAQTSVFPISELGSFQLLDNNGNPATSGCLYFYQAGTSTQQATYTDSTGLSLNSNPVCMSSGGRASIWLSSGQFYKIVACSANDGPTCAPADVLFSVDQVPGSPSALSGSSGPPFISNSPFPATTGMVRLATGDTVCFNNVLHSANLCISKDTTDVLVWAGPGIKMAETVCSSTGLGFDYFCPDSSTHRWKVSNNGAGYVQLVNSGVDVNISDQVTQLHFGATATPLNSTPPTTGQYLVWDGTNVSGQTLPAITPPSFNAPQRVTLGGNVTLNANTNTTVLSEIVTMPATTGSYRLDIRYGLHVIAGANACAAQVVDATNSRGFALSAQNTNGSGYMALTGSEVSPQTYAQSSTATIRLVAVCNATELATPNSGLFTFSPNETSYLSVTPVLSN